MQSSPEDISSTERLLNILRDKGEAIPMRERKKYKEKRFGFFSSKRMGNVGVDIGRNSVNIIRCEGIDGKGLILKKLRTYNIPEDVIGKEPPSIEFLREILKDFGLRKRDNIWTIASYEDVEIRYVRIPKVPEAQINKTLYLVSKKELNLDEKEVIVDFFVHGPVMDKGIEKIGAVVYSVRRDNVENLKALFERIGLHLNGITLSPFAIQNLFLSRWLEIEHETIAYLYVGNDHSRIDVFKDGRLVFTRGFKTATNSIIESIAESYKEKAKAIQGAESEEDIEILDLGSMQDDNMEMDEAKKILFSLIDPEYKKIALQRGYSEDEIFDISIESLERIIRQTERTIDHCVLTFGIPRAGLIFLSWRLCEYPPFIEYISDQLGIECKVMDPLNPSNPHIGDVLISDSLDERQAMSICLGTSISHNRYTPNLLYTFREKEKDQHIRKINKTIFVVFILIMIFLFGLYRYELSVEKRRQERLKDLKAELNQYGLHINKNSLLVQGVNVLKIKDRILSASKRLLPNAILYEISRITPSHIKLLAIRAEMLREGRFDIELEALSIGSEEDAESKIGQYIMDLETSPILSDIRLDRKEWKDDPYYGKCLYFILTLRG